MVGGVCGSAYDGVDVQAGEVTQEKQNSTGHLLKALKLINNCEATMDGFDQNKFHWKRILPIRIILPSSLRMIVYYGEEENPTLTMICMDLL